MWAWHVLDGDRAAVSPSSSHAPRFVRSYSGRSPTGQKPRPRWATRVCRSRRQGIQTGVAVRYGFGFECTAFNWAGGFAGAAVSMLRFPVAWRATDHSSAVLERRSKFAPLADIVESHAMRSIRARPKPYDC